MKLAVNVPAGHCKFLFTVSCFFVSDMITAVHHMPLFMLRFDKSYNMRYSMKVITKLLRKQSIILI